MDVITSNSSSGRPYPSAEELFKRHWPRLIAYAKGIIKDELASEDIVAECLIKYWQRESNFDCPAAAASFLYKSTRNTCLNYLKSEKYKQKSLSNLSTTEIDDSFDLYKLNRSEEIIEDALKAVESLPPLCQKIFILCVIKGISYKLVASYLNISVNTVKTQRSRALQLIRSRYAEVAARRLSM